EIAQKTVCCQVLLSRWGLEKLSKGIETDDISEEAKTMQNVLRQTIKSVPQQDKWLTDKEHELMESDLGKWTEEQSDSVSTIWESLGILLWTLRLENSIPPFYVPFDKQSLFQASKIIPAQSESINNFINRYQNQTYDPLLRSNVEVQQAVNCSEAWYWRARSQTILGLRDVFTSTCDPEVKQHYQKLPKALKDMMNNIDTAILYATTRGLEDKLIEQAVDNDFGVCFDSDTGEEIRDSESRTWKAYRDCTPEELKMMREIAESRLLSFGWLFGRADWDADKDNLGYINPVSSLWSP
ncbi:hypothetical protein BKA69DRAFT_1015966, partial [Paraphysoderma sedebokerense]